MYHAERECLSPSLQIAEFQGVIMRLSPQSELSHYGSNARFLFLVGICSLSEQIVMLCLIGSVLVQSSDSFSVLWYSV